MDWELVSTPGRKCSQDKEGLFEVIYECWKESLKTGWNGAILSGLCPFKDLQDESVMCQQCDSNFSQNECI